MRKAHLCIMTILFIMLVGCSSKPTYEASLKVPEHFTIGQDVPLTLTVIQENQPVTGLTITATLEMKKMDHDTVDVVFTEKGNGEYTANAKITMGGEWIAFTQLKHDDDIIEQEIGFNIEGNE